MENPEREGSRARWGDSSRRAVDAKAAAMEDDDVNFVSSNRVVVVGGGVRRGGGEGRRRTMSVAIAVGGGERGVGCRGGAPREERARGMRARWTRGGGNEGETKAR